MSRTRFRTIKVSREDVIPYGFHMDTDLTECAYKRETDEGCEACQEEMDSADELVAKRELEKGYEVVDISLSNDPWTNTDEDWEFDVTERKQ